MNKFNKRKAIQVALSTLAIERMKKKQEYTNKQIETSKDCNEKYQYRFYLKKAQAAMTTQSLCIDMFHTIPTMIVYVEFSAGTQSNGLRRHATTKYWPFSNHAETEGILNLPAPW